MPAGSTRSRLAATLRLPQRRPVDRPTKLVWTTPPTAKRGQQRRRRGGKPRLAPPPPPAVSKLNCCSSDSKDRCPFRGAAVSRHPRISTGRALYPSPSRSTNVRIVRAIIPRRLARRGAHSAGAHALARCVAVFCKHSVDGPPRSWPLAGPDCTPDACPAHRRRHVVHGCLHLHASIPLRSRCLHHINAHGVVGCGPLHLAVLDWNASRRCGARWLGHRLDTLWISDGPGTPLPPASLAADPARLGLPAPPPAS